VINDEAIEPVEGFNGSAYQRGSILWSGQLLADTATDIVPTPLLYQRLRLGFRRAIVEADSRSRLPEHTHCRGSDAPGTPGNEGGFASE
jgi:hypothetical protein